jgi:plastocyanin
MAETRGVAVKRKLFGIALIVVATAACSSGGDTTTTAGTSDVADEAAISIADFTFSPSDAPVAVGATVTWTNDDSLAHTSTSSDGVWNSDTLQPGDTFSFTFEEAGTFAYTCSIHPSMSGSITVEG